MQSSHHQQHGSPDRSCLFSSALGQLGIAAPHCCESKPVLDCRNWFLLLAWLRSRATELQPRGACSTAFAGPLSATLGYPVQGPGAVATSKRAARWSQTLQEASRWYNSPESVCGDQTCPLRSCEPGAVPAASSRAGRVPRHAAGWGAGLGAAPLGSSPAVTGTAVASQADTDEQRREGRKEGERGAVGLHPPTFPLNKRQG